MHWVIFERGHLPGAARHVRQHTQPLVLSDLQAPDPHDPEYPGAELALAARKMLKLRATHRFSLRGGRNSHGALVCAGLAGISPTIGGLPLDFDGSAGGHHFH